MKPLRSGIHRDNGLGMPKYNCKRFATPAEARQMPRGKRSTQDASTSSLEFLGTFFWEFGGNSGGLWLSFWESLGVILGVFGGHFGSPGGAIGRFFRGVGEGSPPASTPSVLFGAQCGPKGHKKSSKVDPWEALWRTLADLWTHLGSHWVASGGFVGHSEHFGVQNTPKTE